MKYIFIILAILSISGMFAQSEELPQAQRHEISTDLSGAFIDRFRVDYSRRGKKKGALVFGLRTRTESVGVITDTSRMLRLNEGRQFVPRGLRALDLSVGVKSFLGNKQPGRGLWVQFTALTSLVQYRSGAYNSARTNAVFPDEFIEPLRMFGLEGDFGYRYVFDNGLSLNAFISWTMLALRSELISERFTRNQRLSGRFEGVLSGSFLTIGYVW